MVLVITEDRKIIKRLIEKALYVGIKKATGMRMMQGVYLPEEPISYMVVKVLNFTLDLQLG